MRYRPGGELYVEEEGLKNNTALGITVILLVVSAIAAFFTGGYFIGSGNVEAASYMMKGAGSMMTIAIALAFFLWMG